jgi:hypothetical protein
MRAFFLLLVLANMAFYAFTFAARQQDGAGNQAAALQISPEKIRLLGKPGGAPPSGPKPAPATTPERPEAAALLSACLEWGVLAGPDVARADAALAKLDLPPGMVQRTVIDVGGHWVHIPPLKNKAEATRMVTELRRLGIEEFFVVQDPGQWRNAISLGIFRNEEAARNHLGALHKKGVGSAVLERREKFFKQYAYFVREPGEETVAKLATLQRDFPGTQMRAVVCPPAGA